MQCQVQQNSIEGETVHLQEKKHILRRIRNVQNFQGTSPGTAIFRAYFFQCNGLCAETPRMVGRTPHTLKRQIFEGKK